MFDFPGIPQDHFIKLVEPSVLLSGRAKKAYIKLAFYLHGSANNTIQEKSMQYLHEGGPYAMLYVPQQVYP